MKKIKIIAELEADGVSVSILVNGEKISLDNVPSALKDAIETWSPADVMNAIYLAENEEKSQQQ